MQYVTISWARGLSFGAKVVRVAHRSKSTIIPLPQCRSAAVPQAKLKQNTSAAGISAPAKTTPPIWSKMSGESETTERSEEKLPIPWVFALWR